MAGFTLIRLGNLVAPAPMPVIAVSGRDLVANKDRALKPGAKAFVQNPWDDDVLLALVARLLGQPDIYSQPGDLPIWDADEVVT